MAFIDNDDVIKNVPANASYESFGRAVLPRRFERYFDRLHSQRANRPIDEFREDAATIVNKIFIGMSGGKGSLQLGCDPFTRGMEGDIEMDDFPSVVADDEKSIELFVKYRGNGEKIHGRNGMAMIAKECPPVTSVAGPVFSFGHESRHGSFRDLESKLEEFAVDSRRAPGWITQSQLLDEPSDFLASLIGIFLASAFTNKTPIKPKTFSMPADDRFGLHNEY